MMRREHYGNARPVPFTQSVEDFAPGDQGLTSKELPNNIKKLLGLNTMQTAAPTADTILAPEWDEVIITTQLGGPLILSRSFRLTFDRSKVGTSVAQQLAEVLRHGLGAQLEIRWSMSDRSVKTDAVLIFSSTDYVLLNSITKALKDLTNREPNIALSPVTRSHGEHLENPIAETLSGLCVPSATAISLIDATRQQGYPLVLRHAPQHGLAPGTVVHDLVFDTAEEGQLSIPEAALDANGLWFGVTSEGISWKNIAADQVISWRSVGADRR